MTYEEGMVVQRDHRDSSIYRRTTWARGSIKEWKFRSALQSPRLVPNRQLTLLSPIRCIVSAAMVSTDPEVIFAWHQAARALERGSQKRNALPRELILAIFALADCNILLSWEKEEEINVYAGSADVERSDWFATPPLSKGTLEHQPSLQLHTNSHDQGWASDPNAGSWTWFELSIIRQDPQSGEWFEVLEQAETNSEPYRFVSHHNLVAQGEPQDLTGTFEADHEIFKLLQPNDRVVVSACARFGGWGNTGLSARLEFQRRFEPQFI